MATVLVVDDRATNREVACATLDHAGHHVIAAAEGHEALAMARTEHPDVILTDMVMPGMDGYEFVHELRADAGTADIPVLFYTANYRPDEVEPLAFAYGVAKVVAKSADPFDLLTAIDDALTERREPRAAERTSGLLADHLRAVNAKLVEKVMALDESETKFDVLADISPVGIALGGPDMLATYANPRLADITATPVGALLGAGWQHCLADGDRDRLRDRGELAADIGPCYGQVVLGDGRARWLNVIVRRLTDGDQRQTGFMAIIDDVTPLVEAERQRHAQARQREREERERMAQRFDSLARLSGAVAHDFNNMLNIILSFAEFVDDAVAETVGAELTAAHAGAMRHDLRQLTQAGKRAAHLAHQLLTFGGREVVQPTVIDPNTVVGEVCGMVVATAGEQVTLTTVLEPRLRHTRADAAQLCQVLFNLALNARDAMPQGGQLIFRTTNEVYPTSDSPPTALPAGEYVHIAVIDDGDGMPPEVVDRAMEPFFTTKSKGQGTGLGLATAYGIVKQAGGDLTIDSAVGRGTTVDIYLPATDEPLQPGRPATAARAATGQTILLAEDEDGLRAVATRILTNAGYHVLSAANGEEALELARRHDGTIHAALTDVVMPRMNGPELAKALRVQRPGTPVLFMSGFAAPLMTDQGILEPGVTVVGKPFTRDDLLSALNATLAAA